MLNRCAWCMYGREMVLNRLTLILVCPCTDHPPIRPMYTVSRSFSYSTPNVFRHISSASRLLVRVTIASASTWARYKIHFWVFLSHNLSLPYFLPNQISFDTTNPIPPKEGVISRRIFFHFFWHCPTPQARGQAVKKMVGLIFSPYQTILRWKLLSIKFFWRHLPKLLHTGISLSCYMDLSKLIHGFLYIVIWISRFLPNTQS